MAQKGNLDTTSSLHIGHFLSRHSKNESVILLWCSVAQLELNVYKLESGNYEFDDSEIKQKYDNQKQLNAQLQEQKRWLEHELEEVRS